jgi:hypothetical protein
MVNLFQYKTERENSEQNSEDLTEANQTLVL